ncbi:MAG: hypothetical protein J2P18_11855 [Nocardia sp.]|nr:hypothetical protein [Nocardia sp.]
MKVDTDGVAAYGATAAGLAGEMGVAASGAAAADPLLLGPIFGLIGGDFVSAYAAAHAGHVAGIGQLSAVMGSMSAAAGGSAAGYGATDAAHAAALKSVEGLS